MRFTQLRIVAAMAALSLVVLGVDVTGSGASSTRQSQATLSPQTALDWNTIAVNTVRAATPSKFQIEGLIYMSYVQAAVYDAVTTIDGRYVPYQKFGINAAGASPRAAVASAAYTTLSYYFPAQAATLTATYTDYLNKTLSALPAAAKQEGVAVGAAAAQNIIATRWGDGRDAFVGIPYGVAPQPPGVWVFAPPPSIQSAQTPWVASMRPFMLQSASQFRVSAPPALTSPEYAQELNEVETLGGANSTVRTPGQTAIANFWNANVINQANQTARDAATAHKLDLVDTVRLLAMDDMVGADAGIACMDSKYHYLFWRPVTAIRNADKDGNSATTANPTWTPLLTTPNHPEYPAAHGCLSSA
ncbi:MAG: vanadium-dependent haloperoxidase, partial [Gaiellaceae bacterium]